jgi:hypothetical protein
MAKENEPLRELLFTVRGLFHELYHSVEGSNGKLTYPPSYDGVRQLTFKIQEERNLKKAAAAKKVCIHFFFFLSSCTDTL